jgi:predicted ATP-dependent protease
VARNGFLILVLVVSLVANAFLAVSLERANSGDAAQLLTRIDALEIENTELRELIEQENLSRRGYENQLAFYRARLGTTIETVSEANGTAVPGSASLEAPAVLQRAVYDRDGPFISERIEQVGALINVTVEIRPGRGRVLVNTTPLMGELFQDAANTAAYVAQQKTGRDLSQSDVIVSIVADSEVPAVDGGSAGTLMTLLMCSVIEGVQPPGDLIMTGTIDQAGHVGAIGGVVDKAKAAKENGKTLLLLPRENSQLVRYTETPRSYHGFTVIQRVPERIDAKEYLESEIGIRVEYVDSIDDVLGFAR